MNTRGRASSTDIYKSCGYGSVYVISTFFSFIGSLSVGLNALRAFCKCASGGKFESVK